MFYMMIAGLIIFALVYWKDRDVLCVNLEKVHFFVFLMILLTLLRLWLASVLNVFDLGITDINNGLSQVPFWTLGLVFWEDAFFGISIYYMIDKWKWSKYIYLPIVATISIWFGLGHMYQFDLAYFATLVLPYMVFYKLGKKYGFGTTMVCHVIFDMFTFLTFKLSTLVIL